MRPNGREFASELMLSLPTHWPLNDETKNDPLWNWPVEWIERMAERGD